jgi:NADH dehydrogenase [ubiquinone] 1 alpha subcomplex assembly factor 7
VTPLAEKLIRRIGASGPLTVAEYMDACLGDPEHGYYMTRDPFGTHGDFITAPEISQMFGELIGLWAVTVWQAMGAPSRFRLIELGPGRGTLMADALRAAQLVPAFAQAADIRLVETSPVLREAQRRMLSALAPGAVWESGIDTVLAQGAPAIVIANEFLDALPIRQFVRLPAGWHERCVGVDTGGRLVFLTAVDAAPDGSLPPALADAPEGSLIETSPAREGAVAMIAGHMAREGGYALFIDYGHDHSAPGDTLQAVRGHGFDDPLAHPGEADLTAHVDFAAAARAAREAGAAAHGPVPQGVFLERLGLTARAARLGDSAPDRRAEIEAAHHRLAAPEEMGTLFRVLAVGAPHAPVPPGFETG